MRASSYEGFYRAGLQVGGFLPLAVVLLMSLNREFPWRFGLLWHFLAGCLLGLLSATTEIHVIRRESANAWEIMNRIGTASFVGMVILGTLGAQRWYGSGELFSWFLGWGIARLAVVRRAIGPFVPPTESQGRDGE